jgi:hypothetical protein
MEGMPLHKHILPTHHVDKRDGFPHPIFDARYIVLGVPIQYHLRPSDQKVIGLFAEQVFHQERLGRSFQKLPHTFQLEGNVNAFIYEKKEPIRRADAEDLSEAFVRSYPDLQSKFRLHRLPCEIYERWPKDFANPLELEYGGKVKLWEVVFNQRFENRLEITYTWEVLDELGDYISFTHFTDMKNRILFGENHAIGEKRSYRDLIGKFIEETYFVEVPSATIGMEIFMKVGIFSPVRGDRLAIRASRTLPLDESNTRAIIGKIRLLPLR